MKNYLKTITLSEMEMGAFIVIPDENGYTGCPEIRVKTDRNDIIAGMYVPVTVDVQTGLTSYGFPVTMKDVNNLKVHPIAMPNAEVLYDAFNGVEENAILTNSQFEKDSYLSDIMAEAYESM